MNRDKDLNQNNNIDSSKIDKDRDVSQGEFGSATGRTGSVGNMGGGGSDWSRESSTPRSENRKDLGESENVSSSSKEERH